MAFLFFSDHDFPSELYDRKTGGFTTPVKTLLNGADHIVKELPKSDQASIHSIDQNSWTKKFQSHSFNSYFSSLHISERTKAVTEHVMQGANKYLKPTSDKKGKGKAKAEATKEDIDNTAQKDDQQMIKPDILKLVKKAVTVIVLSLSIYSTYEAGVVFNNMKFHDQLELLVLHVKSIILSTEVWIKEHKKLNDNVSNQIEADIKFIKQLVKDLVELDPRSHKKIEAAGWRYGALGGLCVLGGMAISSTAAITGGATLAVGGVIALVSAKARSGKTRCAENRLRIQVTKNVKKFQQADEERKRIIQHEFNIPKNEETVVENPVQQ